MLSPSKREAFAANRKYAVSNLFISSLEILGTSLKNEVFRKTGLNFKFYGNPEERVTKFSLELVFYFESGKVLLVFYL